MDGEHPQINAVLTNRTGPPPFDKPDADITLRSSDHVDFRVRRHILYEASPVFESILSIPPSQEEGSCPVVDLPEDSWTLHTLLLICYPMSRKKRLGHKSLPQLEAAIAAAKKYDMELPLEVLVDELLNSGSRWKSIEIWAVGCRLTLEDVASQAAGWVSMLPLGKPDVRSLGRMEGISAGNYYRLCTTCKKGQLVPTSPLLEPSKKSDQLAGREVDGLAAARPQFRSKMPYPDLECCSADGVVFLVHKCILGMASAVLADRIAAILSPALSQNAGGGASRTSESLTSLSLEEDASVLSEFFSLCYPGEHELSHSPSLCIAVLHAAKKYAATAVEGKAIQHWEVVAKVTSLPAYLVSSRADFRDCARVAARYTLSNPLDNVYHPEMEHSPALAYCHLLAYHENCRTLVKKLIMQAFPDESKTNNEEDEELLRRQRARAERFGTHVTASVVKRAALTKRYTWLYRYVEGRVFKAGIYPTHTPPRSDVCAFEAAMAEGQWDGSSDPFLSSLNRVDAVVCNLTARLDEVALQF